MKVAVIGGGAAGFFAAISAKTHHRDAAVVIFEKSKQTLAKVKVSGGGRCNVTNACESPAEFISHYPRGQKQLKKTFGIFGRKETISWFENQGVKLKSEADGRMFPVTDNSQTIIDCLRSKAEKLGIQMVHKASIEKLTPTDQGFDVELTGRNIQNFKYIIVATGGSPKPSGYDWLASTGHSIVTPVPSLFTFNIPGESELKALMGLSISDATVRILGTKLLQSGPVLITHWGLSGPAVLKLSAWGARPLADIEYNFKIQVNWTGSLNEEALRVGIDDVVQAGNKKKLINSKPIDIPNRLWEYVLNRVNINVNRLWGELGKKDKNRLINVLLNDQYDIVGKTTFKEEFVTCGGVDLAEVDFLTMQSRKVPGLFFAGEVLDIDGVTGGFNFQAAWSTGYVAGKLGK